MSDEIARVAEIFGLDRNIGYQEMETHSRRFGNGRSEIHEVIGIEKNMLSHMNECSA